MSRRKVLVRRKIAQAGGDVNKVIPRPAKAEGVWLTGNLAEGVSLPNPPKKGQGKGNTVTEAIGSRKEALWRNWAKS
jgi:hypothetical protein